VEAKKKDEKICMDTFTGKDDNTTSRISPPQHPRQEEIKEGLSTMKERTKALKD